MKQSLSITSLCSICNERYSYQDAHAVKRHEHPEPQSGSARDAWIASRLPYEQWCESTVEGRAWNQLWLPRVDDLTPGHRYTRHTAASRASATPRVDDLAPSRSYWPKMAHRDTPWLPIATAPIETDILACDSVCYAPESVRLTGDPAKPVYNHATHNYSRGLWPTHWMPLPQPPEKEVEL